MADDRVVHSCVNEGRISRIETRVDANSRHILSVRDYAKDIEDKVDEVDDKRHQDYLSLFKTINDLENEIISIHTTIKDLSVIMTIIGLVITILIAIPDLSAVFHVVG